MPQSRSITVAKFGGTSMGTSKSIQQVAKILTDKNEKVIGVVSATSGTTDALIRLGNEALENQGKKNMAWQKTLDEIIQKHQQIIKELKITLTLETLYQEMKELAQGISLIGELSLSTKDRLMSFGERMSSQILAALLNQTGSHAQAIDAYELVFTDNNFGEGNVDFEKTYKISKAKLSSLLKKGTIPIITGFIGQAENKQYITLGRGGSDYTGAIIAAAVDSNNLEIWTDVDGIFEADPRLIPKARLLEKMSFHEASELAYFGAKVLHPKTIKPAINKNIPVKILNTFNTKAKGSIITNQETNSLKSVTYKKNITIINICSSGMVDAIGFLAKIFEIFARHQVVVDVVATSEVCVSLTVDKGNYSKVIAELEKLGTIEVKNQMAIICLVGSGIRTNREVLSKLFTTLKDHTIEMVSLGASKRNLTFLTEEKNAPTIVTKIFNTFFN